MSQPQTASTIFTKDSAEYIAHVLNNTTDNWTYKIEPNGRGYSVTAYDDKGPVASVSNFPNVDPI
jgi:hypothetical protein